MKKFTLISFSVLLSLTVLAGGTVTITGKITNPKEGELRITRDGLFKSETVIETKVNKDGEFTATFDIPGEGFYNLNHGKEYTQMYLVPGAKMKFTLDTEQFDETVSYKGTGSAPCNYLAQALLQDEKLRMKDWKEYYGLEAQAFVDKSIEIRTAKEKFLSDYEAEHAGLSAQFKKYAKAQINYAWGGEINSYPAYHKNITKNDVEGFSERLNIILKPLLVYDEELLNVAGYRNFINSTVNHEVTAILNVTPDAKGKVGYHVAQSFRIILATIPDQEIKDYLMTNILYNKIKYGGIASVTPMMKQYEAVCSNKGYVAMINEEYKTWAHLAPGSPAPDFTYADINGKKVSLSDFKGKYVYIDVWATWCGPCKKEQPLLKELEEACKNYNIEFLSVSVDTEKKKWEEMVKAQSFGGTQLIADKAFNSTIAKEYNIQGIPRFMLIDKEGNIIDISASRPSGDIKNIIDQLDDITASK